MSADDVTTMRTRRRPTDGRDEPRGTGGAAYVEFLLAFMPILTLFLGLLQIMVLYSARVLTQHAATRAARTASVVVDDDPAYYDGEPRGFVSGPPATAAQLARAYRRHMGSGAGPVIASRRATIELSAMLALLAVTPRDPSGGGDGSGDSLDNRSRLTREFVSVDILHARDNAPATTLASEDIKVRVTFRYPCAVPFAGAIVCDRMRDETVAEATLHNHRADYPYLGGG